MLNEENELVVRTHFHMNRSFCIKTRFDTQEKGNSEMDVMGLFFTGPVRYKFYTNASKLGIF